MNKISTRFGFTLIEMMIAIGLGMLVIFIAMAGLRTAAQAVSKAQKLAVENAIIRAGISLALADTDFWLSHDNPNTAQTVLRNASPSTGVNYQGMSFAPMKSPVFNTARALAKTFVSNGDLSQLPPMITDTLGSNVAIGDKLKNSIAWDPDGWLPHDPRSWSRANLVERFSVESLPLIRNSVPVKNGDNVVRRGSPSLKSTSVRKRQLFGTYYSFFKSAINDGGQPWQNNQLERLKWTLGSYGMLEYLPANTPLVTYTSKANTTPASETIWLISPEWCYTSGLKPPRKYYLGTDSDNGVHHANDQIGATSSFVYAIARPYEVITRADDTLKIRNINYLVDVCSKRYASNVAVGTAGKAGEDTLKDLLDQVDTDRPWLDRYTAPETWPELRVSTIRHMHAGQFRCLNRITWIDNLTGKETQFSFTAFGTTLRGARQQRQPATAAEKWANPFKLTGSADTHLDDY
jgi:type II secretory pathway pseudopilin PulG